MKFFSLIVILCFFLPSYAQKKVRKANVWVKDYTSAANLIHEADQLAARKEYDELKVEAKYLQALNLLQKLAASIVQGENDSLAFLFYSKIGLLWNYFDSLELAKQANLKAIALVNKTNAFEDSTLFQTLLYTGSIYYRQNEFDSAYFFFKKAEIINDKYPHNLNSSERLYNWLGGMYYETGNFKQAGNYFEKALSLLTRSNPFYTDLWIRYKNNIASSMTKLEKFTKADSVYNALLSFGVNTNEILNNIGVVNLRLNKTNKALSYFYRVHFENELNVTLYNQLGKAYTNIGKFDSAYVYFKRAMKESPKWYGSKKSIRRGYTFQFLAELNEKQDEFEMAIRNYQQAIVQFYPSYGDTIGYNNPDTFSGVFSYLDLFNTLIAKANVFEKLYHKDSLLLHLEAALNAYRSAFKLIKYVERVYESDEARMFLNKIKYNIHDKPIQLSLEGYDRTHQKSFLEDAYNFDQQSKASILSLNVETLNLKKNVGFHSDLFNKESSLKTATARLSLKASQLFDSVQLQKINSTIRDNEIQLGVLQEKMNELPGFRAQKFSSSTPTISQVQSLLNGKQIIVSYHLSSSILVTLCITNQDYSFHSQSIDETFFSSIKAFKSVLYNISTRSKFEGGFISSKLYQSLILPIWDKIKQADYLIIIPDDELNSLPFEALQDAGGNYLLEKFVIQYQYSTELLQETKLVKKFNLSTLAFAPFSNKNNNQFSKLEYSKSEVEAIAGKIYLDSAATKYRLLNGEGQHSILHLATHTFINDTLPEKSFVAFFPTDNVPPDETNLYLPEIYNLRLDSTQLVILSACETGIGQLEKGEGLMSISRAFTYAGCPNSIASLWKADDESTAWIIRRFYHYVSRGVNIALALQRAKMDYIQSPEIEKRFKSPPYWAHLVLTGVLQNDPTAYPRFFVIGVVTCLFILLAIFIIHRKIGRKKMISITSDFS